MTEALPVEEEQLREAVRVRYAAAATAVEHGGRATSAAAALTAAEGGTRSAAAGSGGCACGGDGCGCGCGSSGSAQVSVGLYSPDEMAELPGDAVRASLGCGNPTALIDLRPGEVVLDLGSGGGIDVLLSARRVDPGGFAYGVDMTDEMLTLAERNAAEQGATNVRFLKGTIEDLPLPDASVDVVISNCVINLSTDKQRVLTEAFRVLRPGGRFAVSDVLVQGALSEAVRRDTELWVGCVAGALDEAEYRRMLQTAGFGELEVVVTRDHTAERASAVDPSLQVAAGTVRGESGRVVSAFVRARKATAPASASPHA